MQFFLNETREKTKQKTTQQMPKQIGTETHHIYWNDYYYYIWREAHTLCEHSMSNSRWCGVLAVGTVAFASRTYFSHISGDVVSFVSFTDAFWIKKWRTKSWMCLRALRCRNGRTEYEKKNTRGKQLKENIHTPNITTNKQTTDQKAK